MKTVRGPRPKTMSPHDNKPNYGLYQFRYVQNQKNKRKNDNCNGGLLFYLHDVWHPILTSSDGIFIKKYNTDKAAYHDNNDRAGVRDTFANHVHFAGEDGGIVAVPKLHVTESVPSLVHCSVVTCTWGVVCVNAALCW